MVKSQGKDGAALAARHYGAQTFLKSYLHFSKCFSRLTRKSILVSLSSLKVLVNLFEVCQILAFLKQAGNFHGIISSRYWVLLSKAYSNDLAKYVQGFLGLNFFKYTVCPSNLAMISSLLLKSQERLG